MISGYELVRPIGRGSYGEVWLARDTRGAFCAVKIVRWDRTGDPAPHIREFEGIARFVAFSRREPSHLALVHTGIETAEGFLFYAMEIADDANLGREIDPERYVPHTLAELRRRRARLPAREVAAVGVVLARALASLHASGLAHRDIKPSNIVIVGGGPKFADVGLLTATASALAAIGTDGFVPPDGLGTPAADVYGLGKVLYELATGLDRRSFPRLPPEIADWGERGEFLALNDAIGRACDLRDSKPCRLASAFLGELLALTDC